MFKKRINREVICFQGIPAHIAIRPGQSDQHKGQQELPTNEHAVSGIHHRTIQRLYLFNIHIRLYRCANRADGNWHNWKDHAL